MTDKRPTQIWHIVTKQDGRDLPCAIVDNEGRNLVDTYGWEHTPVIRTRALAEQIVAALNDDAEGMVRVVGDLDGVSDWIDVKVIYRPFCQKCSYSLAGARDEDGLREVVSEHNSFKHSDDAR